MKGSSSNLWFRLGAEQGANEEAAARSFEFREGGKWRKWKRWSSSVGLRRRAAAAALGEAEEEEQRDEQRQGRGRSSEEREGGGREAARQGESRGAPDASSGRARERGVKARWRRWWC